MISCKSKTLQLIAVCTVFLLGFIILATGNHDANKYLVVGGVFGAVSSVIVVADIVFWKRTGPMRLLLWRSFSDFGVACRFMFTYQFNQYVCGDSSCNLVVQDHGANDDYHVDITNGNGCGFPSAFFEFFEVASELWFLCVVIDLWISIINPFSSAEKRMIRYHMVVWSVSLAFAIPTWAVPKIGGFWFVDDGVDNTPICWIASHRHDISPFTWVLFFAPLLLINFVAIIALFGAVRRLRVGISDTLIHRIRALVLNAINVVAYLLYWLLALAFLGMAFEMPEIAAQQWGYKCLIYITAARGISAICVWVFSQNIHFQDIAISDGKTNTGDTRSTQSTIDDQITQREQADLNSALRQEILFYATTGIRHCAELKVDVELDKIDISIKQKSDKSHASELSAWFFLNLLVGRKQEKQKITRWAEKSRMRMSRTRGSVLSNTAQFNPLAASDFSYDSRSTGSDHPIPTRPADELQSASKNGNVESPEALDHLSFSLRSEISIEDGISLSKLRSSGLVDAFAGTETAFALVERKSRAPIALGLGCLKSAFALRNQVEFVEYQPYHFRRVRKAGNVSDKIYVEQFATTVKERLVQGGASGALFFFSKDEQFIGKSCSEDELEVLASTAKEYADYFETNEGKNSYLSKIYGVYLLKIYSVRLGFYVMGNLFNRKDDNGVRVPIHEKYDIKGSTVDRSSAPPVEGQLVPCRHCEQLFVYTRKQKKRPTSLRMNKWAAESVRSLTADDEDDSKCRVTVSGRHEPNVTLKDNDLKIKLRLPALVSVKLRQQLENDANFLLSIGVMDYSLLVGVTNVEYDVGSLAEMTPPGSPLSGEESNDGITRSISRKYFAESRKMTVSSSSTSSQGPSQIPLEVCKIVGPFSYQMGIVDYQQRWTYKKKLERFYKVQMRGKDPNGISAIDPASYKDRFINHIQDLLDTDDHSFVPSEDVVSEGCPTSDGDKTADIVARALSQEVHNESFLQT